MKHRAPYWREIYDKTKTELNNRVGYTHPHNGAINRVATAFANFVYDTLKKENYT